MQGKQTPKNEHPEVFKAKGQARRLRDALKEHNLEVSHSVALKLLARTQGFRNWEELEGQLSTSCTVHKLPFAQREAADVQTDDDEWLKWLDWLEALLRMKGFSEEALDDLAYDSHGSVEASEINNDGMYRQLKARLKWHWTCPNWSLEMAKKQTLADLRDLLNTAIAEPSGDSIDARSTGAIPMRVNVASGSTYEQEIWVDALEWFAKVTADDVDLIAGLLADGLHNSEFSDHVGLTLAETSLFPKVREQLKALLEKGTAAQLLDDSVVGITCDIDEAAVRQFVKVMSECGAEFSAETMNSLGLH